MKPPVLADFSWARIAAAVEDVRDRLQRTTAALAAAGVAHVIVGGHAVAAWVARVDQEAVRNTKDVDLLVRREDFARVQAALAAAGFVYANVNGVELFLDGPHGSVRSAIRILFAGERVLPAHPLEAPSVGGTEAGPGFPVPTLAALVRMKLTAFRLKDQVHLLDLLDVGLIDADWAAKLPAALADRLEELLKTRRREAEG